MTGADWIQLAIAAFGAIAAGAAWEAALTSRDSARQIRIGHLMEVHSGRLAALRELRSRMSWITEGGGPRATLTRAEQWAVSMGIPPGTTIVRGVELAGLVKSTGLALPNCLAVAEVMQQKKIGGPIKAALAELDDAMATENAAIGALEAGLARHWWQLKRVPGPNKTG